LSVIRTRDILSRFLRCPLLCRDIVVVISILVFLAPFITKRVDLGFDEGIYLEGGHRVAVRHQLPHRDFFSIAGPGVYLWQAALQKMPWFGFWTKARSSLVIDALLISLSLYAIGRVIAPPASALWSVLLFLGCFAGCANKLYVNHRWDSSALIVTSCALVLTHKWYAAFISGVLCALAVVFTQSTIVVFIVTLMMLLYYRHHSRTSPIAYALGFFTLLLFSILLLWDHGVLTPWLKQMTYLGKYAYLNCVGPFNGLIPRGLGIRTWAVVLPSAIVLFAISSTVVLFRELSDSYRAAFGMALGILVTILPRMSVDYLLFVSPMFFPLALSVGPRVLGRTWRLHVCALLLAIGAACLVALPLEAANGVWLRHRNGWIYMPAAADAEVVMKLRQSVRHGDRLLVYPYLPILVTLTDAESVGFCLYFQPGLATKEQEEATAALISEDPPTWIVKADVPVGVYRAIWPGTVTSEFPIIEGAVRSGFEVVFRMRSGYTVYTLYRRRCQCPVP